MGWQYDFTHVAKRVVAHAHMLDAQPRPVPEELLAPKSENFRLELVATNTKWYNLNDKQDVEREKEREREMPVT